MRKILEGSWKTTCVNYITVHNGSNREQRCQQEDWPVPEGLDSKSSFEEFNL